MTKKAENTEKKLNIYQKINEVMKKVKKLEKDLNVGTGKSSYKGVSEAQVMAMIRPLLAEIGIVIYTKEVVESNEQVIVENSYYDKYQKETVKTEKTRRDTKVDTVYVVVNSDNPEESFEIKSSGYGTDYGDKGIGKALTYAHKYGVMKLFFMTTGDDTDNTHSDDYKGKVKNENWRDKAKETCKKETIKKLSILLRTGSDEATIKHMFETMRLDEFETVIAEAKKIEGVK